MGWPRELLDSAQRNLPKARGERGRAWSGREELFGKERVPAGSCIYAVEQPNRGRGAYDPLDQAPGLGPVQSGEINAFDPIVALELRKSPLDACRRLVGAESGNEQDPASAGRQKEMSEQIKGRAVDPMQILDREHERSICRYAAEQARRRLEKRQSLVRASRRCRGLTRE